MTRFKLDENLPSRAALVLRQAGHDASTVIEEGLGGASDTTLAEACADEDLVLLTLDLDFADIRTYGSPDSPGVVVLRVGRQDVASICGLLERSAQCTAGALPLSYSPPCLRPAADGRVDRGCVVYGELRLPGGREVASTPKPYAERGGWPFGRPPPGA